MGAARCHVAVHPRTFPRISTIEPPAKHECAYSCRLIPPALRVALRHSALAATQSAGDEVKPYQATIDGRTLTVDPIARLVHVTDAPAASDERGARREVRLTPMEFQLLAFLVKHAGKVLTHQMILTNVLGAQHERDVQYFRVYAGELRKKIEVDSVQPRFILTEPGVGYRLLED